MNGLKMKRMSALKAIHIRNKALVETEIFGGPIFDDGEEVLIQEDGMVKNECEGHNIVSMLQVDMLYQLLAVHNIE